MGVLPAYMHAWVPVNPEGSIRYPAMGAIHNCEPACGAGN